VPHSHFPRKGLTKQTRIYYGRSRTPRAPNCSMIGTPCQPPARREACRALTPSPCRPFRALRSTILAHSCDVAGRIRGDRSRPIFWPLLAPSLYFLAMWSSQAETTMTRGDLADDFASSETISPDISARSTIASREQALPGQFWLTRRQILPPPPRKRLSSSSSFPH